MSDNAYPFPQFSAVHGDQLRTSGVPEQYWETLHLKLKEEVFDAGRVFQLVHVEDEDGDESWMVTVAQDQTVNTQDKEHIYLIDHAWTYQIPFARKQLNTVKGLPQRIAALMDIPIMDSKEHELIDAILAKMWRYNQTYQFSGTRSDDDTALEPLWYMMDEFGARVQHSDDPSVRIVPFFYAPRSTAFSIMWPIKDMTDGDEICRDYVEGAVGENNRQAKLSPWFVYDFSEYPFQNIPRADDYFKKFSGGEEVPESPPAPPMLPRQGLKVYSDMSQVCSHLTHPAFKVVPNVEEAQISWLRNHFTDYKTLARVHPNNLINQFPNEMLLTVKDPLAVVCRRAGGQNAGPSWLPVTYSLTDELPEFVSYFQHREKLGLDNLWICKPWNLARGLDIHITSNLDQIVRINESGPKVASKYIHDPVLFRRRDLEEEAAEKAMVKFDIRYIVMLSSTAPLTIYAYKVFWLRFANKPYSLSDFDDYEKHFTVMNYQNPEKLCQIHSNEFIPMFEEQNPEHPWEQVEASIFGMLREMFEAASSEPYPRGMPPSPQSRAIYAVDLMLSWKTDEQGKRVGIEPMVCEVNFCPDCERACKYHPDFYNDVFSTLFLNDTEGRPVQKL